jgi:hypothetical protein
LAWSKSLNTLPLCVFFTNPLKLSLYTTLRFVVLISLLVAFNISFKTSNAAICTALGNGAWNNPANWSCGTVPVCGDSVIIPSAITVTVTTQQDYSGCASGPDIVIYGTLKFDNGNKIKLPCDARIYVMPGGSVAPGTGGGNSNYIEICDDIVWNADSGTLTGPSCLPATSAFCTGVVLPVELVSFTGEPKDGFVDLNWITASEKDCHHFDVERSVDAAAFKKITSLITKAPNGNSQGILKYSVIDDSPITDVSYYRLRQVDVTNASKFSTIISVNYIRSKNIKFVVYPNPNKGEFTADISGLENNHEVTISLKDDRGNVVYESEFFIHDAGSNKLQIIPQHKLSPGLYICTLSLEGIQYNVKVIVS